MSEYHDQESLAERARKILAENERQKKAEDTVELEDSIEHRLKAQIALVKKVKHIFNTVSGAMESALLYTGPVGRAALTVGGWVKSVAEYAMFEREGGDFKRNEDGFRIFSGKRLAQSFAVAACVGLSATAGYHYTYYNATQFQEMVYTTGKQEIVDGELYHVTGCTSLPCSTESDNGKYYQIEKSYFWPRQIYPEEDVYANIPQQIAACEINGYGIYFKEMKWLFKWAEWYQNIESVSCRPLSEGEIQKLMEPAVAPQP